MAQQSKDRMFPRWIVALMWVAGVGLLLYVLRGVLWPVFLAFLIAYMLDPVVDKFEERRLPRAVGIGVMLTLVLGLFAVLLLLAIPGIARDAAAFFGELPGYFTEMRADYEPLLAEYGVEVPPTIHDAMEQWGISGQQLAEAAVPAFGVAKTVFGGTVSALGAAAGLLMIPVFAAYLLHDFDKITAGVRDLVPPRWRPFVVDVAKEVDVVLGQFLRGQLLVMFILAVLYSVAYLVLGVRLAVLIGVVAGVVSFIPYVGGAVALGLAVIMCLIDWNGWLQLAGVVAAYAVIQVFEGFFITPKVVGDKVGLSAIWVLFALLVGGELLGFTGVLLALPAAAVSKIFVVRFVAWYRSSEIFLGEGNEGSSESTIQRILRGEGLKDGPEIAARKREAAQDSGPPTIPDPLPTKPDPE